MTAIDLKEKIGSQVSYYREGWRIGYLESVKGGSARIRPIAAKNAAVKRCFTVPVEDVKEVTG